MSDRPAVIVTGGAGYVGSHVAKALAARGYLPVTLDDLSLGHGWAVRWGPLIRADFADSAALDAIAAAHGPLACIHCAGLISIAESVADPGRYFDVNVARSVGLLHGLNRLGIGRVGFSSSAAVYGPPETNPIPEGHATRPINPYGMTKLAVEQIIAIMARAAGLKGVNLRYFNAAGADPGGEIGEEHVQETHLIPLAIRATRPDAPPMDVFGTDYETRDGTCIRDYVHVSDLADAHVLAIEAMADFADGEVQPLNLGSEAGFSILEVLRAIETVSGRRVQRRIAARRPGDVPALIADGTQARKRLGWRPAHSDLETIVRTAVQWADHGATAMAGA